MGTIVLLMLLAWMLSIAFMTLRSRSESGDNPARSSIRPTPRPINTPMDGVIGPVVSVLPEDAEPSASLR